MIGVIGTDFYVAYANGRTVVICHDGVLSVTPAAGAKVVASNNGSTEATNSVDVSAGQVVVIGTKIEGVAIQPYSTMMKAGMNDTDISRAPEVSPRQEHYHRLDGCRRRFNGCPDTNQFQLEALRV